MASYPKGVFDPEAGPFSQGPPSWSPSARYYPFMDVKGTILDLVAGRVGSYLDSGGLAPAPYPEHATPGAVIRSFESRKFLATYGGSEAVDWVMDGVSLMADAAADAGYHFERGDQMVVAKKNRYTPADAEVVEDDLAHLIAQPNPWQPWSEFIALWVIDYVLTGNAFWLKFRPGTDSGRPLALYRVSPADMGVIPGDRELIAAYVYTPPGSNDPIVMKPSDVIHFRRPNPNSQFLGVGALAGGPVVIDAEQGMAWTLRNFWRKGTKLSMVFQSDRRIPDPTFKKIKRELRYLYAGSDNAYDAAVLQSGLRAVPIQPTAAEAQFATLGDKSRDRISAMIHVPVPLLVQADFQPAVIRESQRLFDTKTMRPILNRNGEKTSLDLTMPGWGLDFKIDYEYTMPDEDRYKNAGALASIPGVKVKEVRAALGWPPLGDARDEIVLNLNQDGTTTGTPPGSGEAGRPVGAATGLNAPTNTDHPGGASRRQNDLPGDLKAVLNNDWEALGIHAPSSE